MPDQSTFVFDFDSTFIKVEALEELAEISLKNHPEKKERLQAIKEITDQGIDGSIEFNESLKKRIALLDAKQEHLELLVKRLKGKISTSIKRNKKFFTENADRIYIISAGFKEFIDPIAAQYKIKTNHVFANSFRYSKKGLIKGFDTKNPLSTTRGKEIQIKQLKLTGEVFVIGDGYSDYQMKNGAKQVSFFAFTENIEREKAIINADHVTPSFDEFLFHNKMPMAISYPKNRINVLLLEDIHPDAAKMFADEGYNVERLSHGLNEAELCKKIKDVSILGIRSKTKLTRKVLKHAERLIGVGAFCIGTNQIDLDGCSERGIVVYNAPFSNTRSVVELVIGEIIMLMRGIPDKNKGMHEGLWLKSAKNSNEIRGRTLGIIGYGNIGSQLSVLAESLGMRVIFYDKGDKLSLGNAVRCGTLRELLKKSDIITLHVDGDADNTKFIGEKEFRLMKDGVIFLNLARGFVVDIDALTKAIKSGKVRGAAVDVFPKEPKSNDEIFKSKLKGLQNVILTPHVGGSTQEAQEHIAGFVPQKIMEYVNTGSSFSSVNFPNLQLPELRSSHRLIHIHHNLPGILAKINSLLADHKINIVGQYLKTNESIGYVITDIDKKYNKKVISELRKIENTIKFRVLY